MRSLLTITALGLAFVAASAGNVARVRGSGSVGRARDDDVPAFAPEIVRTGISSERRITDDKLFDRAARAAWALISRSYYAQTGLASAQPNFPYPTTWD